VQPVEEPALATLSKFDLGHVGIFVRDLTQMVRFYQRVFGFAITDTDLAGDGRPRGVFLSRNPEEHHQLVLVARGGDLIRDQPAMQQVSFRTDSLAEVRRTYSALREAQLKHIDAVTHGTAWCVYFRDPENNRIEIFTDTPWYITQPFVAPVDYNKPDDVIYSETEQLCRTQPGFRMMSQWRVEIAERMQQALTALSQTP
jgi:catechol 2,3-dioxygenase